jgi:hypothetical protein
MKLSNSGINTYTTCGHSYKLNYIDGITSQYKGSALFFGSAIDEALNFMLLNKDSETCLIDSIAVFQNHWQLNKDRKGKETDMPKNPFILYSKWDFDPDLLESSDWAKLYKETNDPIKFRREIEELLKTKKFQDLDKEHQVFYNYCTWLCLKNKGTELLKGYHQQLLPRIKRVVDVQKVFNLVDEDKNVLNGVIDFICVLDDGTLAVADNKTSSFEYEVDSVKTSTQLSLYVKVLNIYNEDPEHEWKEGHIEHAAYFVMSKKLGKNITKICSECGHTGEGSHKTCDNIIETKMTGPGTGKPVRCGGAWKKTKEFTVDTQLVVDKIPETVQNMVIENADYVKTMIREEKFPKNFSSCDGKYGKCQYFNLCWFGSDKHLKQEQR